ncbi:RRM 6 domain containing protein [Asbolus verrucosus]|uniref:RNA-binding region-containing protein 3 n=1 Tax=Asbolus verrucosus TaxID=1661398 RepID=A0A482VBJ2_ASBVE|nr:RRM 6 domain containing protein [Asbolus verrucosus]
MMCEDVLKIKNLPKELTDAEKKDFLKHFGASKVKVITSKAQQKSVVFAKFDSKEVAREVLFRLHQTYILKNRLCVEYADHDIGLPKIKKVEQANSSNKEHFKSFITKLNSFNHSVEFHQPPPPHLKYIYPKANRPTINNIGHALATVPKFYTQVLHLMNKMNLPPPFALQEPLRQQATKPQVQQRNINPPQPKSQESSSESELESDEDSKQHKEIIPQKRVLHQKKSVKRPKFIKPNIVVSASTTKHEKTEDIFEKTDVQTQRKIELKVSATALETKVHEQIEQTNALQSHVDEAEEQSNNTKSDKTIITVEELTANQISAKDLDVLPVFKNYHPGPPTCRLYIKNIAKSVELKDLEYIYHRYKTEASEGKVNNFEIRLMQEGRMKGQAFVTLNSVEIAQKALKETNAYILKDKPLVVVFARTAPSKK